MNVDLPSISLSLSLSFPLKRTPRSQLKRLLIFLSSIKEASEFCPRSIMSDEGEKTCPLCAEEMDLTDQQLKPCRCGYEICVWCWHHIMDMAEKDESEGRCPACRTAYDKDRIVGMAADCERLVQEVNIEKKHKSHKAKVKTSDSRKQLSSVRVIQRNLVYIVGLPLELADEDLLQHKDYFAQYGKVLKVSISRTSAGTIQQFANNTCSVYITYSKEEEAIRCIQSVHGFILDARPLRACFGTTKYCHAWLRNVPCTNPDCLYLHEIGSQEDSFTKDEIISAYTRVQEITGVTNNMQRRAGTVLPPPADDYCNISSAVIEKPSVKNTLTNSASNSKGSPPNSSSGRSGALPPAASWGARVSNCNIPSVSLASSNGSTKQKAETVHEPPVLATIVSDFIPSDIGKKQMSNEEINANQTKSKMENPEMVKKHAGNSSQRNVSEVSSALLVASAGKSVSQSSCSPAISSDVEGGEQLLSTSSLDGQPCFSGEDKGNCSVMDGKIQKLCSDLSSLSTDKQLNSEHSEADRPNGLSLNNFLSPKNQGLQWHESERLQEHSSSTTATTIYSLTAVKEASDVRSDMQASVLHNMSSETEDDFNNQRLRDAIVINQAVIPTSSPLHLLSHLRAPLQSHGGAECAENYTAASSIVNRLTDECLTTNVSSSSVASNGFLDCFVSHTPEQDSSLFFRGLQGSHMGRFDGELPFVESQPALDMGENNIISNILSLDLDSWDDSLTSPQNLAKLLSETEKPEGTVNIAGSFKGQYSNQSRFSFARQEDSRNHLIDMEPSLGNIGQAAKNPPFGQELHGIRDPYFDRMGNGFGFPHWNIELSDNLTSGHSIFPTNKLSLSRSQISAPPGFSAPSRPPPPPGFSSHERSDQTYDLMKSGNHMIDTPSFCRNPYQTPPSGNVSPANDIEFIDPAILAVGKGRLPGGINNSSIDMRSNYPVQPSAFENDSRLQLLMQRSLSPHQNLRYTDVRDNFSPPNDAYGFSSRYMDQSQVSNHVPFSQFSLQQPPRNTAVSNGHWDNWSELQSGNDIGIAELLRNERLGNKFYGGYEDAKFRMTNSGDIYNRSFGM